MKNFHPAHIKYDEQNNEICQSVVIHSKNTAAYTAQIMQLIGLYNTGYLTGILHDMGKLTDKFKIYIEKSSRGEKVVKGSVNHTFAGVIFLFEKYYNKFTDIKDITCEIIAYAVGAHHGLFDCISSNGADGFNHRVLKDKNELCYDEALQNYFLECTSEVELNMLFENAADEIQSFINRVMSSCDNRSSFSYFIGMVERLLLSALIEGDRRDTVEFMTGIEKSNFSDDMKQVWTERLFCIEEKIKEFNTDTEINKARCKISDICKGFAKNQTGIYRLTVPTGSGKTLSSLRYALAHSAKYNKKTIFFVVPLLSVIEQNAKEIKKYIGKNELVLEHHSNVVKEESCFDELNINEMIAENWESPVVITTLVQLLNTLFLDKTTCVRRMHSLCNSIIIIDEIQSLPIRMISLMNETLNFLSSVCNTTIILCSATQPCFENVNHPLKFGTKTDIVAYEKELWKTFKRTQIIDKRTKSGYTKEQIVDFSIEIMSESKSLLIICNTKKTAKDIFDYLNQIKCYNTEPFLLFHLSTSMCMQHRNDTLDEIKSHLGIDRVVCISTQLVEAGVDFSFECVVRACAGLDNIIQAAGRCNRNGEHIGQRNVYIVNFQNENLNSLKEICNAQDATNQFLFRYSENCTEFENDMLSDKSVKAYYDYLYKNKNVSKSFNYPLPQFDSDIFDMLSLNKQFVNRCKEFKGYILRQAFKTAGENFIIFDENTTDVIVPYNETAKKIIADLYSEKAKYDFKYLSVKIKEAKPYTVSLFEYQMRKLEDSGGLHTSSAFPFITVNERFYDEKTGISDVPLII